MAYTDKLNALRTDIQGAIDATESGEQPADHLLQTLSILNQAYGVDGTPDLSVDRSIGTVASKVIKASAGRLYALQCTNLAAATRYLQLFDRSTALSGGETPIASFPVYANAGLLTLTSEDFGANGVNFTTGICWGFSTTPLTYTAGTGSNAIVIGRYV